MQSLSSCVPVGVPTLGVRRCQSVSSRPRLVVRAEEPKVVGEYKEGDENITKPSKTPSSAYIDDLPEIPRTEMSSGMKAKLRQEYYSLGGSPNKPMGANWFLYIALFIGSLAILSAALGYI